MSISLVCPHCARHTLASPAHLQTWNDFDQGYRAITHGERAFWRDRDGHLQWHIAICNACFEPMLLATFENENERILARVIPAPKPNPVDSRIPEPMKSALKEAKVCLAAGANIATAIMARRALEDFVNANGATGKNLFQKIDSLVAAHTITPAQRDLAHGTRMVGNDAAHGNGEEDPLRDVTKEDAEEAGELRGNAVRAVLRAGRDGRRSGGSPEKVPTRTSLQAAVIAVSSGQTRCKAEQPCGRPGM